MTDESKVKMRGYIVSQEMPLPQPEMPLAWLVNRLALNDLGQPLKQGIFSNYNDDIVFDLDENTIPGRYDPARGPAQRLEIGDGLSIDKEDGILYADLSAITKEYIDTMTVAVAGDTMTGPLLLNFPWANIVLNVPDDTTAPVIIGQHAGKSRWQMQFGNQNAAADFSLYAYDDPAINLKHVFNITRATGTAKFNYGLEVHGLGLYVTAPGATIQNALNVTGILSVSGAATVGGALTVSGATTLNGAATFNGPTTIVGTISGATAFSGAVTFNNSVNFGSRVAASPANLSQHLSLYSNSYGFSITGGTLNAVANGASIFHLTDSSLTIDTSIIVQNTYSGTLRVYGDGDRLRWRGSQFSVISHHNTDAFYLMLTNDWDPDGSWNSLRPFSINKNGNVTMSHYVSVGGLGCGAATFTTAATDGATMMGKSYAYIGWEGTGGGAGALEVRAGDANWDAFMSFHCPGRFATYFGLRAHDNNFWFGGWSHGSVAWRFWTTRDNGQMCCSVRTVHAGDADHNDSPSAGVSEPFGATAMVTGLGNGTSGGYIRARYRYLQMFLANIGWVNVEAVPGP